MNDLTNHEFWNGFWSSVKPQRKFWLSYKEGEKLLRRVLKFIPMNGSVLELGGAPGSMALRIHMIRSDLTIDCIDFSERGVSKTIELYKVHDMKGRVIFGDFRDYKESENSYDLVCSFGLVEHFADFCDVIKKHFEFAKIGAHVFFVVPNYTHDFVMKMLSLFSHETLETHNFAVMDLQVLKQCVVGGGGTEIESGAFGGSEFPHSTVNKSFGGYIYRRFAQGWNLTESMLNIFLLGRFKFCLWNSQMYVVAKRL